MENFKLLDKILDATYQILSGIVRLNLGLVPGAMCMVKFGPTLMKT